MADFLSGRNEFRIRFARETFSILRWVSGPVVHTLSRNNISIRNGESNKRVIFTIVSVPIYYRRGARARTPRRTAATTPLDHFQLAIIQYRAQTSNNRPRQSSYRYHVYYRNVIKCPLPSALLLLPHSRAFLPPR